MKIGAVINNASGVLTPEQNEKRLTQIKTHLNGRVSPDNLAIVPGNQIRIELKRILNDGIDVLIIGGGDGTVSSAANLVINKEISLLVLALGTKNNFARDAAIPLDPLEAIDLLDRMHVQQIDAGEVNGHIFINNATLGLYPKIVKEREKTEKQGWRKWWAKIVATIRVIKRIPRMRMSVEGEQISSTLFTPFLFVGNNEYKEIMNSDFFRPSLSEGKLWLCIARSYGLGSLLLMAWHLTVKGIKGAENLEAHLLEKATVNTWKKNVTAAIDGENYKLITPLRFKIHPKSLRVVVP